MRNEKAELAFKKTDDEPRTTCCLGEFENCLATDIIFDENSIRNSLKTSPLNWGGK
jgi:hypothetical protein